jgi:hypothetical protein
MYGRIVVVRERFPYGKGQVNTVMVNGQGESPEITVTNFGQGEVSWQSVRIQFGGICISLLGEPGQNLAGDISNALIGGLLNIKQS